MSTFESSLLTADERPSAARISFWPVAALIWGYAFLVWGLSTVFRDGYMVPDMSVMLRSGVAVLLIVFVVSAPVLLFQTLQSGRSLTTRAGWRNLRSRFNGTFLMRWFIGASLFWPFKAAFRVAKVAIPDIVPFQWDPLLAEIERAVHLGVWPWEVAGWLVPDGALLRALDSFYSPGWFYTVVLVVPLMAVVAPSNRHTVRFLSVYVLSWIVVGNVLAIPMSSVGPIFFGRVYPELADPFARLVAALDAPYAKGVSAELWAGYTGTAPPFGISAMPSVHVATAMALYLYFRKMAWPFHLLGATYLVLVLLGSVRLAWHYAIDGYVSIAVVCGLWWVVGRWMRPEFTGTRSRATGEQRVAAVGSAV